MKRIYYIIPIILLVTACGMQRPVVYPKNRFETTSKSQADIDITECQGLADEYVKSDPATVVVKSITDSGGTGAIVNKVSGIIMKTMGSGSPAGSITDAAGDLFQGLLRASEQSSVHQSFVARCLQERKYEIIG